MSKRHLKKSIRWLILWKRIKRWFKLYYTMNKTCCWSVFFAVVLGFDWFFVSLNEIQDLHLKGPESMGGYASTILLAYIINILLVHVTFPYKNTGTWTMQITRTVHVFRWSQLRWFSLGDIQRRAVKKGGHEVRQAVILHSIATSPTPSG
jgi:apolipoprotein N-acyltransferase